MQRATTSSSLLATLLCLGLPIACGGDVDEIPDDGDILPPDATFLVSGTVYDLETGDPVASQASVIVDGVSPAPTVSVSGADFTIEAPANSTFHLLAGAPPSYRSTYNAAIEVRSEALSGVELFVVSEAYLAQLASDFGVTPSAADGIIMIRVVDDTGAPASGVPASAFVIPDGAVGPFFLDADMGADAEATETSASGMAILYDVAPGLTNLTSDPEASVAIAYPVSPVAASAVTYMQATISEGGIVRPQNVSFAADVLPIFGDRGCISCHDGGGIGKDLGGLHFNGAVEKSYNEVTQELSPIYGVARVDLENPANSLILTMPSSEDPPDSHPFATFLGPNDPDYLTILVWIEEGALKN